MHMLLKPSITEMTQKRPHFTHPFFLGLNIHYLQQKAILYIKRHKLKMGYPEEMDVVR